MCASAVLQLDDDQWRQVETQAWLTLPVVEPARLLVTVVACLWDCPVLPALLVSDEEA